jgi:hypothetical protein
LRTSFSPAEGPTQEPSKERKRGVVEPSTAHIIFSYLFIFV